MSKLFTLRELSEYLHINEGKIVTLVDAGVISAYKIGGELLRFRKEQIDATRTEIEFRAKETSGAPVAETRKTSREKLEISSGKKKNDTFQDEVADFFYFNDFYIISAVLVVVLLVVIFRG